MRIPSGMSMATVVLAAVLVSVGCSDTERVLDTMPSEVVGDGNVVEQTRAIAGCTGVELAGVGDLHIRQGSSEALLVRAESNLMPYLNTDLQGGDLVVWKEPITLWNTEPIEYHLTVTDLARVSLTGAGDVHGEDLAVGALSIARTGVGTIDLAEVSASSVGLASSGVGATVLSGSVQRQSIDLSGLGDYDGSALASAEADVTIRNGRTATVRVSDVLRVTIHGGGTVLYIGDPVVEHHGTGRVTRIGG